MSKKRPAEPTGRNAIKTAEPIMRSLFVEMHARRITLKSMAETIGRSDVALTRWKKGTTTPTMFDVAAVAGVLGYEIVLKKRDV